jgi:hypothetical protein
MDYVNVVVHVFQTQIREYYNIEFVGRCKNNCNNKQILKKKKRRMAKDNNPTPNKFKVSPWLVYTAILLIFFYL